LEDIATLLLGIFVESFTKSSRRVSGGNEAEICFSKSFPG
jgi:hypothetical protein